jgi:D-lactate dehydrogenase
MLYWDDTMAQLSSLPQVLVTPHQAFLTHEALTEIAECTKQNILEFAEELDDAENDDASREDVSNTTRVC